MSEAQKRKIGNANRGKIRSPEVLEAMSNRMKDHIPWNKGMKMSEEFCQKNSETHKGQPCPMKGKTHTDETKEKMSLAKIGYIPWNRGQKFPQFSGENSSNWKGGITPENARLRNSFEFDQWRTAVFTRDNYTCRACGCRGGDLHPHHIMFWSTFPEGRFLVANGQTLCVKCHRKLHRAVCKWNKEARIIVR